MTLNKDFYCKSCGEVLAIDLVQSDGWFHYIQHNDGTIEEWNDEKHEEDWGFYNSVKTSGTFETFQNPDGIYYLINPKDFKLLENIPPFTRGNGCCDWSGIDVYCVCGEQLGDADLDCWQSKAVGLNFLKVGMR